MVFVAGSPSNAEFTRLLTSTKMLMIYVCGYGTKSNGIKTAVGIRRHLNTWIAQKPCARKRFLHMVTINHVPTQMSQANMYSIIESASLIHDRPVEQWVPPAGARRGKLGSTGLGSRMGAIAGAVF